ncbi:hypothetical protein OIU78_024246 [Salix suchowensis]|nr:hypothetical protein OIU78_024246 [Salix suchowensis]
MDTKSDIPNLSNILFFTVKSPPLLHNLAFFVTLSHFFSATKHPSSLKMKFGKSLSNQIEGTLPEWRDKFLSYKELKKRLKLIEPNNSSSTTKNNGDSRPLKKPRFAAAEGGGGGDCKEGIMTKEEIDFIKLLEDELEKFNSFFVEKEEEYIIRLKELQDSVAQANNSNEEMIKIRKEIVDIHGEMVLLENYSALNYTGTSIHSYSN